MSAVRRCFTCGYELEGLSSSEICPECGNPAFDVGEVIDPAGLRRQKVKLWGAVFIFFVFALFAAICAGVR